MEGTEVANTKLYRVDVKGSATPRVIEAVSAAAALKHAAFGMFTASLIRSPVETAGLLAGGAKLEKAGETPTAEPVTLPDGGAILALAGDVLAGHDVPLSDDGIFAALVDDNELPDTPEGRAAFDAALKAGRDAGEFGAAHETPAEPSAKGKK